MKTKKSIVALYLLGVHLALGVALIRPDKVSSTEIEFGMRETPDEIIIPRLREVHRQMDTSIPAGATIFLGDSITMALATSAIASHAVNFGIGWQRSDQLIQSMASYESIKRAERVVVMIGTNDVLQGKGRGIDQRYRAILQKIPANIPVVMVGIPPMGDVVFQGRKIVDSDIRQVVRDGHAACQADPRCRFVSAYDLLTKDGALRSSVLLADNIHLTQHGYAILIDAIVHAQLAQDASRERK